MTNPRAKEEFLEWIAYLRYITNNPYLKQAIDQIQGRGLEMYDEGYLAAQCDRDAAITKDLGDLLAKYSWM